ncbi:hypothetical protein E0Z10_g5933 [Xylaria hypoxylon]|uniref:Rhodopsin domain-containing protein n=1 Tax=Xylaria hypoxylon TaxID=37992 RepID=A0A4Z0YFI4_9PEZI|nr:hypothetical protein E0Z10_g5933 [Xylaria hypoxylon]
MAFNIYTISRCGQELFTVDIIFTVLDLVFLGLRFWALRFSRRKFQPDDFFALFAFVAKSVLTGAAIWGTWNGLGKHITELNLDQLTVQVKLLLISEFTYLTGTACVKLTMLFLYHRIYTTPVFRRWNYGAIAFVALYFISFIPVFLTNCIPLSQYWDPKPTGWCRDTLIFDNATVAANLLLDFAVLILPLPVLWRLQMSIRDKLTVTSMFSIGLVTIALVSWRFGVTLKTRDSPDWTRSLCKVGEIASLEIHLGIIGVCIPTLGPLFNAYISPALHKMGITKSTSTSKSGGKNLYLETIGGSTLNKRSRKYTELSESVDHIISRDDDSIKLTPTVDGRVVAECTSRPINATRTPDHGPGRIHVQRDIEAQYHPKKVDYFEE